MQSGLASGSKKFQLLDQRTLNHVPSFSATSFCIDPLLLCSWRFPPALPGRPASSSTCSATNGNLQAWPTGISQTEGVTPNGYNGSNYFTPDAFPAGTAGGTLTNINSHFTDPAGTMTRCVSTCMFRQRQRDGKRGPRVAALRLERHGQHGQPGFRLLRVLPVPRQHEHAQQRHQRQRRRGRDV